MTREQQDKLWNDLSVENQKTLQREYQEFNDIIELRDGTPEEIAKAYGQRQTLWALFGSHNLNPKPLTYEDVAMELFGENNEKQYGTFCCPVFSEGHCDKISAINALINVAKYLNGDWKPDWENNEEEKWSIRIVWDENNKPVIKVGFYFGTANGAIGHCNNTFVYFRTEELAQQAIQILGEETIRLALSTDY